MKLKQLMHPSSILMMIAIVMLTIALTMLHRINNTVEIMEAEIRQLVEELPSDLEWLEFGWTLQYDSLNK